MKLFRYVSKAPLPSSPPSEVERRYGKIVFKKNHLRLAILVVITLLAGLILPRQTSAQIVINELMWMGSDLSTADEWIELINTDSDDVVLDKWTLNYIKDGAEVLMIEFDDISIQSDEFFIISNYNSSNSRLKNEPDLVTSSVSLPNSKLLLRLRNASGALVDEVDDGSGAPFAGNNPSGTGAKASMERIDTNISGTDESNWRSSTDCVGFDDGLEIFGTPWFPNSEPEPEPDPQPEPEPDPEPIVLPPILITEILANPIGRDDQEWIELMNFGTGTVNLNGLILKKGSSEYQISNDYMLDALHAIALRKTQTDISLRNQGDTIELWYGSELIDSLEYAQTAEEVSFGRDPQDPETLTAFCIPTPGSINSFKKLDPMIVMQSGDVWGREKLSVNLIAEVKEGSLDSAECRWDYGDGEIVSGCNPTSHTFDEVGEYTIELLVDTYCSMGLRETLLVQVRGEKIDEKEVKEIKDEKEIKEEEEETQALTQEQVFPPADTEDSVCIPTVSSGVIISEIFPAPSDGEEWIELLNLTDKRFNLCGWVLDDVRDGGSKHWTISEEFDIAPHGFLVLTKDETGIALNNGGDEVWLVSPEGEFEIGVTYPKIKKDYSYSLRSGLSRRMGHGLVSAAGGAVRDSAVVTLAGEPASPARRSSKSVGGSYCVTEKATPGKKNVCPVEHLDVREQVEQEPVADSIQPMQAKPLPTLKTKYVNVVHEDEVEAEEDVLTGALFANLLIEEPLSNETIEVGSQRDVATLPPISIVEVIMIIGGVCTSGFLMAFKVLKG
ncbi:MAG: lamin tail domain-containing protein [Kiritimatiellales bacterium]|nr:lamin tail domain-containing protein [Kiritimatiellales bacterium]